MRTTVIFIVLVSFVRTGLGKEAGWNAQEIYSGSHVNSATAHDYDGDAKQEILFSAEGKFFMYFGPEYD